MYNLLEFAERADVREVASRFLELEAVQGMVVDYDPLWLLAWRFRNTRLEDYFSYLNERRTLAQGWDWTDLLGSARWAPFQPTTGFEKIDSNWRPRGWSSRRIPSEWSPFVLKVCLRPAGHGDEQEDFLRTLEGDDLPFELIFESRPLARLSAGNKAVFRPVEGGVSIGTASQPAGTLGGILKDKFGACFGVTCSHVVGSAGIVEQPSPRDSRRSTRIGACSHATTLVPSPRTTLCNPWISGGSSNAVDVAIFPIDSSVIAVNSIVGIGAPMSVTPKTGLSVGQHVEFSGRTSGHRRVEVGGLALTYKFQFAGNEYCFNNLFELKGVSRTMLPWLRPKAVRPGDSGAWVCDPNSTGHGWCGMVIGDDSGIGYATFSEDVTDWIHSEGLSLTP